MPTLPPYLDPDVQLAMNGDWSRLSPEARKHLGLGPADPPRPLSFAEAQWGVGATRFPDEPFVKPLMPPEDDERFGGTIFGSDAPMGGPLAPPPERPLPEIRNEQAGDRNKAYETLDQCRSGRGGVSWNECFAASELWGRELAAGNPDALRRLSPADKEAMGRDPNAAVTGPLGPADVEKVMHHGHNTGQPPSSGLSPEDEAKARDGTPGERGPSPVAEPKNDVERNALAQMLAVQDGMKVENDPNYKGPPTPTRTPAELLAELRQKLTGDPTKEVDPSTPQDLISAAIYPSPAPQAPAAMADVVAAVPPSVSLRPINPGETLESIVCAPHGLTGDQCLEAIRPIANANDLRFDPNSTIYIDEPLDTNRPLVIPPDPAAVDAHEGELLRQSAQGNADALADRHQQLNPPPPPPPPEEEEVDCPFFSLTPCGGLIMDPAFVAAVGEGDVGGAFAATGNYIADWYQNGPTPTNNVVHNTLADGVHVIAHIPESAVTLAVDLGDQFVWEPIQAPFISDDLDQRPGETDLEYHERTGRSPVSGKFAQGYRDVVDEEAGETVGGAFHDRPISTGLTYLGPLGLLLPTRSPVGKTPKARGAYPRPIFETGLPRSAPRSTFPDVNGGGRWAPEACIVCEVPLGRSPEKPGPGAGSPRPGRRPPTTRPRSRSNGPDTTRPPGSRSPAQQPRPSPAVERRPTSAEGRGPSGSSDPSSATPRSGDVPVRQPSAPRHAPAPAAPNHGAGGSAPNRPASGTTQSRPPRSRRPRGRPDRWWNAPVTPRRTSRPGGAQRRPGESRRKARQRRLNETVQAVDKNGRPKVNKRGRPVYTQRRNLTRNERRALARIEDGLCGACREAFADRRLVFVDALTAPTPGRGDGAPAERRELPEAEVTIPESRDGHSSRPQHEPVEHPRGGMDKQKEHTLEYSKRETPLAEDVNAARMRLKTARQEAAAAAEAAKRAKALAREADPETVPVARQRARDLSTLASIARTKLKQAKKELGQARTRQDALFWREGVFGRWMYTKAGRVLANMASKAALLGVIGGHVFGVSHVVRFVDHLAPMTDSVAVVRTIDAAPPKGSVIEGVVDGSSSKPSSTTHAVETPEPLHSKPRMSDASPDASGSFFTRLFHVDDLPGPALPHPTQRGGPGLLLRALSHFGGRVVGAYFTSQDALSDWKARRGLRKEESPVEVTVGTGSNAWADLIERLKQIAYESEPGAYVLVRVPKGAIILASHVAELGAQLGLRAQVGYNASQLGRHSFQVVLRRGARASFEIDVRSDSPGERQTLDHALTFSARALRPGDELKLHTPQVFSDAELLRIAEEHGFHAVDFHSGEASDVIVLRRRPSSAPAPALEATASRARVPGWVDGVQASLARGDLGGVLVSLRGLIGDAHVAAAASPRRAPSSPRRHPELRIAALAQAAIELLLAGAPDAVTLRDVEDAGVTLPSKGSDAERDLNLLLARMLGMVAVLTAAGTAAGAAGGPRGRDPTSADPSRAVSDTAPAEQSLPIDDDRQTKSGLDPPARQGQGADPRTGTIDTTSGNSSDASKPGRVSPARSRRTPRIVGLVLALAFAAPLTSDAPAPTQAQQSVVMTQDARDLPHGLPPVGSQTSSLPARRGRRGGDGPQHGPAESPGVKQRLIVEVERALGLTLTDASRTRLHDVPAPELRDFIDWVRSGRRGPWLRGVLQRNIAQRSHADGAAQLQMLFEGRGLRAGPALSNALADAFPRTFHEQASPPAPQRLQDAIRMALQQLVPPGTRVPLAELEQELGMLGLRPGANAAMTEPELIDEINSGAHPDHRVVLAAGGKYVVVGLRRRGPRSDHSDEESFDPEQWRLSNEDLRKAGEREQARREQERGEAPAPQADPGKGRDSTRNRPGWGYWDPGSFGAIGGPLVVLAVAATMGSPVLAWMPDWLPLAFGVGATIVGAARLWRWVARNLRPGTATRAGDRTRAPPWKRRLAVVGAGAAIAAAAWGTNAAAQPPAAAAPSARPAVVLEGQRAASPSPCACLAAPIRGPPADPDAPVGSQQQRIQAGDSTWQIEEDRLQLEESAAATREGRAPRLVNDNALFQGEVDRRVRLFPANNGGRDPSLIYPNEWLTFATPRVAVGPAPEKIAPPTGDLEPPSGAGPPAQAEPRSSSYHEWLPYVLGAAFAAGAIVVMRHWNPAAGGKRRTRRQRRRALERLAWEAAELRAILADANRRLAAEGASAGELADARHARDAAEWFIDQLKGHAREARAELLARPDGPIDLGTELGNPVGITWASGAALSGALALVAMPVAPGHGWIVPVVAAFTTIVALTDRSPGAGLTPRLPSPAEIAAREERETFARLKDLVPAYERALTDATALEDVDPHAARLGRADREARLALDAVAVAVTTLRSNVGASRRARRIRSLLEAMEPLLSALPETPEHATLRRSVPTGLRRADFLDRLAGYMERAASALMTEMVTLGEEAAWLLDTFEEAKARTLAEAVEALDDSRSIEASVRQALVRDVATAAATGRALTDDLTQTPRALAELEQVAYDVDVRIRYAAELRLRASGARVAAELVRLARVLAQRGSVPSVKRPRGREVEQGRVVVDLTNKSATVIPDGGGPLYTYGPGVTTRNAARSIAADGWRFAADSEWTLTSPPDGFWRRVVRKATRPSVRGGGHGRLYSVGTPFALALVMPQAGPAALAAAALIAAGVAALPWAMRLVTPGVPARAAARGGGGSRAPPGSSSAGGGGGAGAPPVLLGPVDPGRAPPRDSLPPTVLVDQIPTAVKPGLRGPVSIRGPPPARRRPREGRS